MSGFIIIIIIITTTTTTTTTTTNTTITQQMTCHKQEGRNSRQSELKKPCDLDTQVVLSLSLPNVKCFVNTCG